MAARPTGELTFQANGSSFVLTFDFNALCEMEDALDMGVADLQDAMQSPRMKMVRTIFRIGLARHHPTVTDQQAGEIIGEVGIQRAADMIGQAFAAAFPAAEGGGTTGARPPESA